MFFFNKDKLIIAAVDIGTASIKSVAIKKEGDKLMLENYNELYTAPYVGREPGEFVKLGYHELAIAIEDSYKELKVKPDKLVIGIPASQCIFRNVKMPLRMLQVGKEENVETLIKLEFKKMVVGVEVLTYSFTFSELARDEVSIEYLVLAIKLEYLSAINKMVMDMDVDYVLEPNIFGGLISLPPEIHDDNVVLINIGANNINIAFINAGRMYGVENVEVGVNKVIFSVKSSRLIGYREAREMVLSFDYAKNDEDIVSDTIKLSTINIINEIAHILNRYELRYNIKYSKVYIGGSCAGIKGSQAFYGDNLKKEVHIIDSFERISVPEVLRSVLSSNSSVFMNATGLAIKHIT